MTYRRLSSHPSLNSHSGAILSGGHGGLGSGNALEYNLIGVVTQSSLGRCNDSFVISFCLRYTHYESCGAFSSRF